MNFSSLHLYQILITVIAGIMIVQGFNKFVKGKSGQTFYKFFVRFIVWGGMAVIALFPTLSRSMAKFIGIEGNVNAVVLTGFILVFLMIFRLLSAIERLEQQISELTRKESLENIKEKTNAS